MFVPTILTTPGLQSGYVPHPFVRGASTVNEGSHVACYQVSPPAIAMSNIHSSSFKKKTSIKSTSSSSFHPHPGASQHGSQSQSELTTSKTNLYIAGLSEKVTDRMVRRMVEGVIEPKSCKALLNQHGKCTGTGFIDCLSEEDATKAKHFLETMYGGPVSAPNKDEKHGVYDDADNSSASLNGSPKLNENSSAKQINNCNGSEISLSTPEDKQHEISATVTLSASTCPPSIEIVREGRKLEVKYAFENEKDSLNVYVRNLPRSGFGSQQLKELFSEFGEVTSVKMLETVGGDSFTGAGFVRFNTSEEASKAINTINERNQILPSCDQPLRCKLADRRMRSIPLNHSFIPSTGGTLSSINITTTTVPEALYSYPSNPFAQNFIPSSAPFACLGQSQPSLDPLPLVPPSAVPSLSWFRHHTPSVTLPAHPAEAPGLPTNGSLLVAPDLLHPGPPVILQVSSGASLMTYTPFKINGQQFWRPVYIPNSVVAGTAAAGGGANSLASPLFVPPCLQPLTQPPQLQPCLISQSDNKHSTNSYMGYPLQQGTTTLSPGDLSLSPDQLYQAMLHQWKQHFHLQPLFSTPPSFHSGVVPMNPACDQSVDGFTQLLLSHLAPLNSAKITSVPSTVGQLSSLAMEPIFGGAAYLVHPLDAHPLSHIMQAGQSTTSSCETQHPSSNSKSKAIHAGQYSTATQCSLMVPIK